MPQHPTIRHAHDGGLANGLWVLLLLLLLLLRAIILVLLLRVAAFAVAGRVTSHGNPQRGG